MALQLAVNSENITAFYALTSLFPHELVRISYIYRQASEEVEYFCQRILSFARFHAYEGSQRKWGTSWCLGYVHSSQGMLLL